jgi:putative PepSY-like beta-lactamase-inhibitor
MKQAKWLLMAGVMTLVVACGENSTKTESETSDSTTVTPSTSTTAVAEVPATTKTTFETKYPAATNVQWSRYYEPVPVEWDLAGWPTLDTTDYVVMFDYDGYDYYSWYDENGNWIGATYTIPDHSQLPAAVNNAIKTKFAGYTIVEVDKEMDKSRSAYEVELHKGDDKIKVLFAENGSVIKQKSRINDIKTKEKAKDSAA